MNEHTVHRGVCRYVVLHHTGVDEPHYDLLFETSPASPLIAFRLTQWPPTRSQIATKLRDHRRLYLTYQGPISGDRGEVFRADEGTFHVTEGPTGYELSHAPGHPFARIDSPTDPGSPEWSIHLPHDP